MIRIDVSHDDARQHLADVDALASYGLVILAHYQGTGGYDLLVDSPWPTSTLKAIGLDAAPARRYAVPV